MSVVDLPPITGTIDEVRAFLRAVKAAKSDPQRAHRLTSLDIERGEAGAQSVRYLCDVLEQHPIVKWIDIRLQDNDFDDMAEWLARISVQTQLFNHVLNVAIKLEKAVAIAAGGPIHVTDGEPEGPHEIRLWSRLLKDSEDEIINRLCRSRHVLASEDRLRAWWTTNDEYTVQGYVLKVKLPDNLDAIMGV